MTMAARHNAGSDINGTRAGLILSIRAFLKDPTMVGSAFPASRWLVRAMLAHMPWSNIRTFIEYGPGTGVFTREILGHLSQDAVLVAIDTSPDFIAYLQSAISDQRLHALVGSAVDVAQLLKDRQLPQADCIMSGLPFSTLSPTEAADIMAASHAVLGPDALFCAYQMRRAIEPYMQDHFGYVSRSREWRNIPPCYLYWAHPMQPEPYA